ncbi:MAG: hypothetical protein KAI79_07240, partial [Bacteroidales bacterium]|nr:hypothetical protein [Bacteroidales bacterium]
IQNKSFQAVISILRALASSDDRIIDYFQTVDSATSVGGDGLINFDIPIGFNIDIEEFNNAIKLSIISKLKKLKWRPFEEAREFVRSLRLENGNEWKLYCKKQNSKPRDIPSTPNQIYKLIGWNGIKDWLGTEYLPFVEARRFTRELGLKSQKEWNQYSKSELEGYENKPYNIPSTPSNIYAEWNGIKDWLGYNVTDRYMSYEAASRYVQRCNVNSRDTWRKFSKELRPKNLPALPNEIYKENGWIDWQHFFGTAKYLYSKAKEFAYTLNLYSPQEWKDYCDGKRKDLEIKPINIPPNPKQYYKTDWIDWEDFLGNNKYLSYEESKKFMYSLELKTTLEWKKYSKGELEGYTKRPNNIPTAPDYVYKDKGWIDFSDWLGTGRKRKGNSIEDNNTWLPYEKARDFVRTLKLKSTAEWQQYIKSELTHLPEKPVNVPNSAYFVYKDNGWKGMNDWLGNDGKTQTKVENALSFEKARAFVRTLELKSESEWNDYKNGKFEHLKPLPFNIPKLPRKYYKDDGWIGIRDWLGI